MSEKTDRLIDQIAEVRAANNKHFMQMWKLAFRLAPEEAAAIQSAIRMGDVRISELSAALADQSIWGST